MNDLQRSMQRRRSAVGFSVLAFAFSAGLWANASAQDRAERKAAADQVVYHIDNAAEQGLKGLRNIRNHLDVAAQTKIIVVTHANGVDLLLEGAKEAKSGTAYAPLISALRARGVRFEVCEITLKNRDLKKDQFILDADFVPSGVVRIAQLQNREGFAYIKP